MTTRTSSTASTRKLSTAWRQHGLAGDLPNIAWAIRPRAGSIAARDHHPIALPPRPHGRFSRAHPARHRLCLYLAPSHGQAQAISIGPVRIETPVILAR